MTDHPRRGPASAAAGATGQLGRAPRRPQPLHARVRGLMALVVAAVTGAYFLQLLIERPAGPVSPLVTAVFMGSLTAWAVLHYRGHARRATDVLLVVALVGIALTVPTEGWVWGPCFLVVVQRGIDARPGAAWGWAATAFGAYQLAVGRLDGIEQVLSINTLATAVEYVVAAVFVRILGSALTVNERASERERILAEGLSRLVGADDEAQLAAVVADTTRALGGTPTATASVWIAEGDGWFRRAASVGGYRIPQDAIDIHAFPDSFGQALGLGRPFITDARVLREVFGGRDIAGEQTFATAPVMVDGDMVCTIVLQDDGRISDELVEAMVRFATEVSAVWQRVVLLRQLREANDELLQAAEIKDQFISTVSHELRTPLTSVIGFVDVLLRGWDRLDDARKLEYLEVVRDQAERQGELVEDLLTMSRIVAGEARPDAALVDLRLAAKRSAAAAQVEMSWTGDPAADAPAAAAWADRRHVEQILTNLLTNARKYGAPPYELDLSVVDGQVRVAVVDHGEGVPESFTPQLFERFSQANTGDGRSATGFGLGLAISSELARINGGELSHEPTPDGGATFVLTLPAAVAEPTDDAPAVSAGAHPA